MTSQDAARIIKISDRERARTMEKVRRYEAECRTIDRIAQGASGG